MHPMPLPHFLALIFAVIVAAALTLWAAFAVGLAEIVILLAAHSAAVVLHLGQGGQDRRNDPRV
jgi:hypothetical protein